MELRADECNPERMVDERLAGATHLTAMRPLCLVERPVDQLPVDAGIVGLDVGNQLVDEIVLMAFCIDDRHGLSLLVPFRVTGTRADLPKGPRP